ncbi:MAG: SIR2 family protein [Oscillospiraceae bacterium]
MEIKFEDIMKYDENNWKSFLVLLRNFSEIGCYVGTGLSLFCKSWGDPFREMVKRMDENEYFRNLSNSVLAKADKYGVPINKKNIRGLLNGYIDNQKYLEVGELLDAILREKSWSFDEEFTNIMRNMNGKAKKRANKCMEDMDAEMLPKEAVYYVPYIGSEMKGFYITTNCDISIEYVFRDLKISYHQYSGSDLSEKDILQASENRENEKQIFYIHGRIQCGGDGGGAKNLVLTKSAYDRAYLSKESFNIKLITDSVYKKTLLFLGASLDADPVVQYLNPSIRSNTERRVHVAFFREDKSNNVKRQYIRDKTNRLLRMGIRTIWVPDFSCYATILCQLIREANSDFWRFNSIFNTPWGRREQTNRSDEDEKMKKMMESDCKYERAEYEDKIFVLSILRDYVFEDGSIERKPGWSICYVNRVDFNFPINIINARNEKRSFRPEDYNAPLGNTIYLIDNELGSDFCEKLEITIRSWTENENKFEGIRIRVVRLGAIRNKISDGSVSQNKEINDGNVIQSKEINDGSVSQNKEINEMYINPEKRENKKSSISHKLIKGDKKKEIELDEYKEN